MAKFNPNGAGKGSRSKVSRTNFTGANKAKTSPKSKASSNVSKVLNHNLTKSQIDALCQKAGTSGENELYRMLYNIVNQQGKGYPFGTIFRNVYIMNGDGVPATEIDMVLVHPTGIYLFEMKNHKGFYDNCSNQKYWFKYYYSQKYNQLMYAGNDHIMYSPVLQNQGHINALCAALRSEGFDMTSVNEKVMISYVVLGNSMFLRQKVAMPYLKVINLNDLLSVLPVNVMQRGIIFDEMFYNKLCTFFRSHTRGVTDKMKKEHINFVKKQRKGGY